MFSAPAVQALMMSMTAGAATLLGALFLFFPLKDGGRVLPVALGFAGGLMLCVSLTELYPDAEQVFRALFPVKTAALYGIGFLAVGVGTAVLIERLIPQNGDGEDGLFRVGLVSAVAVGAHNFPEGMATFMAGYGNPAWGLSIMAAVALHNIPEGIAVALPIYYATGSKRKAFFCTFLSGMAEPAGALTAFLILRPLIGDFLLAAVFCAVAGIMIYISLKELIPSALKGNTENPAVTAMLAGICLMLFIHAVQ